MGQTITTGKTFTADETVTNTKLQNIANDATITKMTDADGDTKIDTEESSDEDILRLDAGGTEIVTVQSGKIEPGTDNTIDLGSSSKEFKDLHIDGTANIDTLAGGVAMTIADTDNVDGLTITQNDVTNDKDNISLVNSTTGAGTKINMSGDGPHLNLLGDPTVASPTDGDLWYTGSALNFRDGASTVDLLSTVDTNAVVKGWVNLTMDTAYAINDSFNVSGIVDDGAGLVTVTWDTDFANANYAPVALTSQGRVAAILTVAVGSTAFDSRLIDGTETLVDSDPFCVIAIGDQ